MDNNLTSPEDQSNQTNESTSTQAASEPVFAQPVYSAEPNPTSPPPDSSAKPVKRNIKWPIIVTILVIIIICLLGTVAYLTLTPKSWTPPSPSPVASMTPYPTYPTASPAPTDQPLETMTVTTWHANRKPIKLDVFHPYGFDNTMSTLEIRTDKAEFAEVGTFADGGSLIYASIPVDAPGGGFIARFYKDKAGKIFFLESYIDTWYKDSLRPLLLPTILPRNIKFTNGEAPLEITYGSNTLGITRDLDVYADADEYKNLRFLQKTTYGDIYEQTVVDTNYKDSLTRSLYLKLPDQTLVVYYLKNKFVMDNKAPAVYFSSNPKQVNTDIYKQYIYARCSGSATESMVVIRDQAVIANKVEIGKTSTGDAIYKVQDPNSELVGALYEAYKVSHVGDGDFLTKEAFAKEQNHFLWQDSLGDWEIFVNNKYGTLAECGKPVIYLYPEKETPVSVEVNAEITKSEPTYPAGGWQVYAYPDGRVVYNGQMYESLFWEGFGSGPYADKTGQGFVVEQTKVVATIKDQLKQLGLNQKETQDFMDFWEDKLPTTPYVQLTWLTTEDMDALAPLRVRPAPQTKIRVFLEFVGLEKPIKLTPQKLSAPAREGFTLIEWGGLLRN